MRPLILVPSVLGTRLVDGRGRSLWGSSLRLYRGPALAGAAAATAGVLERFTIGPFAYDVYGGLIRALERAGYRRGIDLFPMAYDWRAGIAAASEQLAALADEIGAPVDLVGVSTGGLVMRAFVAGGGAVGRAVYVGTPQRGTLSALGTLMKGSQPAPFGRTFAPAELAQIQTCWDILPHPDERVFVDAGGAPLELDLYDAEVWGRFGLCPGATGVAARLAAARRLHRALERAPRHEAYVIGGRHRPTPTRAVVDGERVQAPECSPRGRPPAALYADGDGMVPVDSLVALPELAPGRVRHVATREHRKLASDARVHALVLEALAALP